jgi:hypothetical protein
MSPEDQPGIEGLMGSGEVGDVVCERQSEQRALRKWQTAQLMRLGLSRRIAALFADSVDWHQLEDLLRRGCPLGLALEIAR